MSVFDCLKKNTRLPLYVPPLRWREEHLEHLRVSKTISKLELPTIPSDILEALNPIPGTPAPRSKKYVDLRWFCESAIFELLEAIGLSYKYYAQTDRHRIDLTLKRIKTPIVPDCVVYAHTNYIDQRVFVAILSSVQESRLPGAEMLRRLPKRYVVQRDQRKYPLSPFSFAALLAIAQNRYYCCRSLELYEADLIYIEADCSVTLISAEFTGKYIEHVITGGGELGDDVNVRLSVLEGLSGPDSWSHYQPFLWLVKEHFEETEHVDE
ncbi:hypothetical protein TWF102_002443 [Orbilia oligospora]|uniref:Uncharacterized protein n=1 Tax=Orbilia oligospora TaxID=2813651 RepID=A0A7C8N3L5_ORBOL|nr:hypothetical protein TWF102_002443 [Orbilia oligospora]KAF3082155.1 hypothetical protein TWF706_001911 [Orbilia oligospora]KAF3086689.1 hypothetical protein TWF103_001712 [Orbilia oligospora]